MERRIWWPLIKLSLKKGKEKAETSEKQAKLKVKRD